MDGPRACSEDEFGEAIALINSVFRAERSPNSLTLSRRQLAALIFGRHESVEPPPVPGSHILNRLFPFYFPVWALDRS